MGKTYPRHNARTVSRADRLRRMNQDKNTRVITKYIAGGTAMMGVMDEMRKAGQVSAELLNASAGFLISPFDLPGVAVLFEGAWMDLDENGVDRAGNPDFLTADEPSPAGAFAYNTILVNIRKTDLVHRPGWDELSVARSHVFRRDL